MIKKFIPHIILKIMLNTVILCNTDMLESELMFCLYLFSLSTRVRNNDLNRFADDFCSEKKVSSFVTGKISSSPILL